MANYAPLTLAQLFKDLENDAEKCPDCGQYVALLKKDTWEFSGCACEGKTFNIPDHVVVGPESGPLFFYRKKRN
jgi:hypothetical protein